MPTRRLLAALFLTAAATGVIAAPTYATDYAGSTDYWGDLTASISSGTLTAFKTKTGRLQTCSGKPDGSSLSDPQNLLYTGDPVAIVDGKFHLEGTTTDNYGYPFHWTVDGSISLDGRQLSGTATSSGDTLRGEHCVGTWNFEAIIPAHQTDLPVQRTFEPTSNNRSSNPSVTFDYRRGVITHLTAQIAPECVGIGVMGGNISTTAYDLDPIRVDKAGRFTITGALLDAYGVVSHYILSGQIKGYLATGTLSSYRYDDVNGQTLKCTQDTVWKSITEASTTTRGPAAYFDVVALRHGTPGAYSYYLQVKVTGCAHANRARVAVAGGPSRTIGCHGRARLGPMTPKQTYRVNVTALKTRRGRVVRRAPAVSTNIYLPGEDGNWVPLP